METVTISPKFQVVIPQRVREAIGLRSGDKARVIPYRNRIEIVPVRPIRALRGYLKGNIIKYASRAGHKDAPAQDIGKLAWYAAKLQQMGE